LGDNDRATADYDKATQLNPKLAQLNDDLIWKAKTSKSSVTASSHEMVQISPNVALPLNLPDRFPKAKGGDHLGIVDRNEAIRLEYEAAKEQLMRPRLLPEARIPFNLWGGQ
jgi:hypothetical protein